MKQLIFMSNQRILVFINSIIGSFPYSNKVIGAIFNYLQQVLSEQSTRPLGLQVQVLQSSPAGNFCPTSYF